MTVCIWGIKKVVNGLLIDDGHINNIHILEEVLVNSHSSFQDKELDLARNLIVFPLHGYLFPMAPQRFSFSSLFLGQVVVLLPALLFLSISSFHLHLKSEIGSDNKLPHVISSGNLGISSV